MGKGSSCLGDGERLLYGLSQSIMAELGRESEPGASCRFSMEEDFG